MPKTINMTTRFGEVRNGCMTMNQYADNKHIALQLWDEEGPYAGITVNVRGIRAFPENCSAVDVNNFPDAVRLIRETGIGKHTGKYLVSGWCNYPVYEFDAEKVREYVWA